VLTGAAFAIDYESGGADAFRATAFKSPLKWTPFKSPRKAAIAKRYR